MLEGWESKGKNALGKLGSQRETQSNFYSEENRFVFFIYYQFSDGKVGFLHNFSCIKDKGNRYHFDLSKLLLKWKVLVCYPSI